MAETELERAERRFEQARARLQALKNREATKQRKLDTRRKVILGGALVDLAERDDGARAMLERLVRNLVREQDREVCDGWSVDAADETGRSGSESDELSSAEAERSEAGLSGEERTGTDAPEIATESRQARLDRMIANVSSHGGEPA